MEVSSSVLKKLPAGYLRVSVVNKQGLDSLKSIVKQMLCHKMSEAFAGVPGKGRAEGE